MPSYSTVFIDWHNTLCRNRFWEQWSGPGHPQNSAFDSLQRAFFTDSTRLVIPWMRGELTAEEAVHLIARKTGVNEELLMRELIVSCRAMKLVDPEAPALIEKLRSRGLRVVLATDNMDTFTRWTVPSLGLGEIFDDILCSHELGCLKEELDNHGGSRFFGRYLAHHGIGPGESLLLDDSVTVGGVLEPLGIDCRTVLSPEEVIRALQRLVSTAQAPMCRSRCCPAGY